MRRTARIPTGVGDAPLGSIRLVDARASVNQRQLRRNGLAGWQSATTAGLLTAWDLVAKPGVFFDVGANAGVYSLLCRVLWPSIRAVAFEPSPSTVRAGVQWAGANGVDVVFEQAAVSETDGRAPLYLSKKSDASNSLVAGFREPSATVDVELVTLDGYVERTGVAPTVVKIDVERHEPAVIRGARETLGAHRPVVVMEVLGAGPSGSARGAHQLLEGLGYQPHDLGSRDRLYWPGRTPTEWDERFAGWLEAVSRCVP